MSSSTDVIGTKLFFTQAQTHTHTHTHTHNRGPISHQDLHGFIYLPSAGFLISPKHLSETGGGAAEHAGLPLKTQHNTFI